MEKSEKNFLERLADAIPGLSGYRSKDDRRETDKRLREYLAGRIDRIRGGIDDLKLAMTNRGELAALNDVGLLQRQLQQLGDSVRFASYGYSGLFDQLKLRDAELDALYQHDLKLVDAVEALDRAVKAGDLAASREAYAAADDVFAKRKSLFEAP